MVERGVEGASSAEALEEAEDVVLHAMQLEARVGKHLGRREPADLGLGWDSEAIDLVVAAVDAAPWSSHGRLSVQAMVPGGVEMLVGAVQDPTFGPLVVCGSGGVLVELVADLAFRIHPLGVRDAAEMIDELKGARLLRGYRGAPPVDEQALRDVLLRVSALLTICPEVQELDINPLKVLASGARAVDVRARIDRPTATTAARRAQY
jgi:acyl-CoA synthetase (NDP forming)